MGNAFNPQCVRFENVKIFQQHKNKFCERIAIVKRRHDNKLFALKTLRKQQYMKLKSKEIEIQSMIHHPKICKLYYTLENKYHIVMVLEYIKGLNLLQRMHKLPNPSENEIRSVLKDLCEATSYLHRNKIIHRDIKAENIVYDQIMTSVKLIDFGFSEIIPDEKTFLHKACGSVAYVAPEIIQGKPYSFSADYWSIGVVMFIMFFNEFPYGDINTTQHMQKLKDCHPILFPHSISQEATEILSGFLIHDPNKRLTVDEALKHPWFFQT